MDGEQPELLVGTQAKEVSETRLLTSFLAAFDECWFDTNRWAFEGLPHWDVKGAVQRNCPAKTRPGEIILAGQTVRVASCVNPQSSL